MTVQQISIFLENKFGRLNEILNMITREGVYIVAATVSDTSEFGILRIITTDPQKAIQILKSNRISANLSEVFAIRTAARAGQFAQTIQYFTQAGISVEYMYCFSTKETGVLIIRVNNSEAAQGVIKEKELKCITQSELVVND